MKRFYISLLVLAPLCIPSVAFASLTPQSATLNGSAGVIISVNPGDNIRVKLTGLLTDKSKWKGTDWGINTTGATPFCINTKNHHANNNGDDRDRDNDNDADDKPALNIFTDTFTIKAPAQEGVYSTYFRLDDKNNCGSPGSVLALPWSILVGHPVLPPPVIAPHSDVTVPGGPSGATVTYTNPTATDQFDGTDPVSCTPASGSFFPIGSTVVTCTAHDSLGLLATPSTFNVVVLDTTPPVIAPHTNISATTTDPAGATITYDTPTATDNYDQSVVVSCIPASGSLFPLGTTTVACVATDTAGNAATTTFAVGVASATPPSPTPFVMASQPDESYLCAPDWRNCYTGGMANVAIPLGQISAGVVLQSITISKDPNPLYAPYYWSVGVLCYEEAAYVTPCSTFLTSAYATSTTDGQHWTGYVPFTFDPAKYYKLYIADNLADIPAYGTPTEPYWVMIGLH